MYGVPPSQNHLLYESGLLTAPSKLYPVDIMPIGIYLVNQGGSHRLNSSSLAAARAEKYGFLIKRSVNITFYTYFVHSTFSLIEYLVAV